MGYYFIERGGEVSIWMLFMNILNEANLFISNFKTFCFFYYKVKFNIFLKKKKHMKLISTKMIKTIEFLFIKVR